MAEEVGEIIMSITSTLKSICDEAGIELPKEFDSLATERNGRIDILTNGTAELPLQAHKKQYLDLLRPLKGYGWQINFGGNRVMVAPPKDDNADEADTVLTGKRKTVGSIHEVTNLLTGHVSEAWKGAKVIGDSKVYVPATKVSQHHKDVLATNVRELERAGWNVEANTNGLGLTNTVAHYALTAPLEYSPTDDVKVSLARALHLGKSEASWISRGVARGRTIVFDKQSAGQAYNYALGHVRNLLARGWAVERREGLTQEVAITAPANALTTAN